MLKVKNIYERQCCFAKEDSIMLGDELSIDLLTSSSKLTSKKDKKVSVKYNSEK